MNTFFTDKLLQGSLFFKLAVSDLSTRYLVLHFRALRPFIFKLSVQNLNQSQPANIEKHQAFIRKGRGRYVTLTLTVSKLAVQVVCILSSIHYNRIQHDHALMH